MRKLIAAINMTLDGYCDHTAGIPDDEIHQHYVDLLANLDVMIWGRKTYQLMEEYWPLVVENPTGNKPTDDFAERADSITKVVFSHTLSDVSWNNARLSKGTLEEEIVALKRKPGKDIGVGSPSLIVQASNLNLIDEYQLNVWPIILGKGLTLFKNINDQIDLKLVKTKTFSCGALLHYYVPNLNQKVQ
jgi:dihydrofolate reductase